MVEFHYGDWVQVKPEHDVPPIMRPNGEPTRGRVAELAGDVLMVYVPIGDTVDPLTEHSQCVPYEPHQLEPCDPPSPRKQGRPR
jgi:hypothetical protein